MRLIADLHIHTLVSHHAYSTVRENILEARARRLACIAITDHVYGMPDSGNTWHFGNMCVWPREMEGLLVLRGAEANILGPSGDIDLSPRDQQALDLVIASLHTYCVPPTTSRDHTCAMEAAVQHPRVDILGHPASADFAFDEEWIVSQCAKHHTLLEINENAMQRRPSIAPINERLLKLCMKKQAQIIVSSDAHICYSVARFDQSVGLLDRVDFPEELVFNAHESRVLGLLRRK